MAVITLTAAAAPVTGANGIIGAVASTPTTSLGIAGIKAAANSNGQNSAAYTYAGGAGAGDTIDNANLLKGVSTKSRLYSFLTAQYLDQAALDAEIAALGIVQSTNGGTALRLVTAGNAVPTATINGTVATGSIRIALGAAISI